MLWAFRFWYRPPPHFPQAHQWPQTLISLLSGLKKQRGASSHCSLSIFQRNVPVLNKCEKRKMVELRDLSDFNGQGEFFHVLPATRCGNSVLPCVMRIGKGWSLGRKGETSHIARPPAGVAPSPPTTSLFALSTECRMFTFPPVLAGSYLRLSRDHALVLPLTFNR